MAAAGGRIMEYFDNAVKVYEWLDDESAGLAALAAAKTATPAHRDRMIARLRVESSGLQVWVGSIPELKRPIGRIEGLAATISAKPWSVREASEAQHQLREVAPGYLKALKKSDPGVFRSKYPALFEVDKTTELVQAAESIKRKELERGIEVMEKLKDLEGFESEEAQRTLRQGIEQAKSDLNNS